MTQRALFVYTHFGRILPGQCSFYISLLICARRYFQYGVVLVNAAGSDRPLGCHEYPLIGQARITLLLWMTHLFDEVQHFSAVPQYYHFP